MDKKQQTIKDFGEQWTNYTENEGIYASTDTLQDLCGPLLDIKEFENMSIADIGSGSGRIVNMLLDAKAGHVTAIEPSEAFEVLKANTKSRKEKISYLNLLGDEIPINSNFDYVVSFGVIHHIPEPDSTMKAMHNSLKNGGKAIIWLYGYEGNEIYLTLVKPLRTITTKIPHKMLHYTCKVLDFILALYIKACSKIKLPMHEYMNNVLAKWTPHTRFITIYDQLNPAYAKYYKQEEVIDLLKRAGFSNIKTYHRHAYSWTVIGDK